MTVNAVIFDIGNVLMTWAPEPFYDGVIGRSAAARCLRPSICMP